MDTKINELIDYYKLQPHPEGGFFTETYRSKNKVTFDDSNCTAINRSASTAIMFLITENSCSRLHRILSDEVWHFYLGDSMTVVELDLNAENHCRLTRLGSNIIQGEKVQYVVKAGTWFGSYANDLSIYSLVGCTVAPGFEFQDFELGSQHKLTEEFPLAKLIIEKLTKGLP